MIRDTDKDWSRVAEESPYWGVLSDDQFRGSDISAEARKPFFASGEKYINDLFGFIRRHLIKDFQVRSGLDFGCGVGRLLIPLAQAAETAIGVDVAPKMIELAKANLLAAGIKNASVVSSDDTLSLVQGPFNFVNAYIVLQHIPPERGMRLVHHLMSLLEVGGVFSLQTTFAKQRRFFPHEKMQAAYYRRAGNIIQDLMPLNSVTPEGTITMFDYDMNEMMLHVMEVAGQPILVLPTNHDGHMGVHFIGVKARS